VERVSVQPGRRLPAKSPGGRADLTGVIASVVLAVFLACIVSAPATPPPLRIMPLGDSITMGIGSATTSSYRIDLQNRLRGAGLGVDFVGSQGNGAPASADLDNEGHSGWTIARIAAKADEWLATYRPDAILLQIGTNDLRTAHGAIGATGRLSALIDQLMTAAPAADIFVARITGTRSAAAADQQRRTDAYNAKVPGIVASKGARVHVVDQSTVRGIDIRDGLHPNDFGYAKMSWNWYRALAGVYGRSWPAGGNPYLATRGNFCHLVDSDPGPGWAPYFDCRWYYRNLVAGVWTWQTKRKVIVRVGGRLFAADKWVSFDPNRRSR
jgi:lysophospholipase L1-like esterase